MSGFINTPPLSAITYNPSNFTSNSATLTTETAKRLFCDINDIRLRYTSLITPGTASASKALVVDSGRSITNINSFTSTSVNTTRISLGNVTSSFPISDLDSSITNLSTSNVMLIGKAATAKNSFQTTYYHTADDSNANQLQISPFGGTSSLTIHSDGDVCIGNDSSKKGAALSISTPFSHIKLYDTEASVPGDTTMVCQSGALQLLSSNASNTAFYSFGCGTVPQLNIGGTLFRDNHILDLGARSQYNHICLYQLGSNGSYMLGANDSCINYTSAGVNGHRWFYNSTTTPAVTGTQIMDLNGSGDLRVSRHIIAQTAGLHTYGVSVSGLPTGMGGHFHYSSSASRAELFAYNYGTLSWGNVMVNDSLFVNGTTKRCGIGNTSPAFPLDVTSTVNGSIPGTYGFLSNGGAGVSPSATNVPISIYSSGRVLATEFDAYSDVRTKTNIKSLELDDALDFIKLDAKSYIFNDQGYETLGFIAQDLLKTGNERIQNIVTYHSNESMEEHVDEDGFVSPAGKLLTMSLSKITPIHHRLIQHLMERIEALESLIATKKSRAKKER